MGNLLKNVKNFFSKVFTNAPTWAQKASTILTVASPITNELIVLSAGEENAEAVVAVVHEVQADLAAASHIITEAHGTNPTLTPTKAQTLNSALTSITTNLDALLTAGHIKDDTTKTKVEASAKMLIGEIQAILTVIPTATVPAA